MTEHANSPVFCSFCGRNQQEVRGLAAGPAVYICTNCVRSAIELFATQMNCRPEHVYFLLAFNVGSTQELVAKVTATKDSPVEITGAAPRPSE